MRLRAFPSLRSSPQEERCLPRGSEGSGQRRRGRVLLADPPGSPGQVRGCRDLRSPWSPAPTQSMPGLCTRVPGPGSPHKCPEGPVCTPHLGPASGHASCSPCHPPVATSALTHLLSAGRLGAWAANMRLHCPVCLRLQDLSGHYAHPFPICPKPPGFSPALPSVWLGGARGPPPHPELQGPPPRCQRGPGGSCVPGPTAGTGRYSLVLQL